MKSNRAMVFVLCLAAVMLASCHQAEPVMVNVRVRDSDRTGERYYEDWTKLKTHTVADLKGYRGNDIPIGRYGDRTDITLDKTGYYHTRKADGKWWAVSPDGHPLISIGMNALNLNASDRVLEIFKARYKTPDKWMDEAIGLLQRYGYNGAGAWADDEQIRAYNERNDGRFSYCVLLNLVADYKNTLDKSSGYDSDKKLMPVFGKGFEDYCRMRASELAEYKDDSNLFGYFLDNELTFSRDMLDYYLELPKNETGYDAAVKWLAGKGLAADGALTDQIRDEFRAYVLDRYLSVATSAIRKVDSNHMILGSRFYWNDRIYRNDNQSGMLTNPMVFKTAGKYLDIVCCNYYYRWTPVQEEINAWTEWSGKPFMITEWYVKGDDMGLDNNSGAGWIVGTQKERGLFYQNYALGLLKSPNCVGWHWFRYQDEGQWGSSINSNKGVVDYDFKPYYPTLDEMGELNSQVYGLRDRF